MTDCYLFEAWDRLLLVIGSSRPCLPPLCEIDDGRIERVCKGGEREGEEREGKGRARESGRSTFGSTGTAF